MKISISRNGTELGEWTEEEVRSFYKEGQLVATDYYWKEGMAEWAELLKMIKPTPPFTKTALQVKEELPVTNEQPAPAIEEPSNGGINRLTFIGLLVGWWGLTAILSFFMSADIIMGIGFFVVITLVAARLVNMGSKQVYCLLFLIPFVNLYILYICLFQAPNSVKKK